MGKINLKIISSYIFLLYLLLLPIKVYAADIGITNPATDGQKIIKEEEILNIDWNVDNTVNLNFSYELNIKDSICKELISSVSKVDTKSIKPGGYSHQVSTKDLEYGTYCINLCIYDLSEIECYNRTFELSNAKLVSISDEGDSLTANKPPQIKSYPSQLNLNYKENFFYQINAQDPNGDAFTYRLISAPDFIYLNQKKGTITNTIIMRPGSYFIAFVVIDRNGSFTQQNFTINVFEKYDSNGKPLNPTPTPLDPEIKRNFEIVNPKKAELLAGTNNLIQWKIENIDYDKIEIFFQKNGSDKTLLHTVEDKSKKSYEWDVSGLTNGEYSILMEVKKNNITIENKQVNNLMVSNDINSSALLILNLKPLNQSETVDRKPEISANLIPSESGEIKLDKIEVQLDGKKITDACSLNNNEIKCFPTSDLAMKEHIIKMKVTDSNNQEVQQQWTFSVVEKVPDPTPIPSGGTQPNLSPTPEKGDGSENFLQGFIDQLQQIGMNTWLLCCGGILLLGIIVFIFRSLRGRTANSYSLSRNMEDANETTRAELASVTPKMGEGDSELEDFTDYSVGNYSVGEDYEPIVPSTQINNDTAKQENIDVGSSELSTPSFGSSDSDILPDWLKGDSEESSKPVNNDGEIMSDTYNSTNLSDGSKVHDNFGLSTDNNVDEDKKKSQ
ncbi:hypothetical protein KBD45_05595 [Candidatus Dojkabacteria bacterium]|nr:hypothetical protein [Candidatus Dojkabacteria bacterium]